MSNVAHQTETSILKKVFFEMCFDINWLSPNITPSDLACLSRILLDQGGGLNFFSDPERGWGFFLDASKANIFNKCYKKGVCMKKKPFEYGYL